MKKLLAIIVLGLLFSGNAFAGYGKGELKLTENGVRGFHSYITNPGGKKKGVANPLRMVVSHNGNYVHWFVCRASQCTSDGDTELIKICERKQSNPCSTFAVRRSVKWKNGVNSGGKAAAFKKSMSLDEVKEKLVALGFYDGDVETRKKTNFITKKTEVKKPLVKKPKKSAKIYSLNETRPIALKWDGYADLIAGTIEINEKDYKGEINLTLPNKDGSCKGAYSLQKDGRGTWQISCTNNMGAAGSLEWVRDGGTTGKGRDYEDKKVQFTVANKS